MPVKTPDGKVYAVTYPAKLEDNGAGSPDGSARYYISYSNGVSVLHQLYNTAQDFTINGFPAWVQIPDSWYFYTRGVSSNSGGANGYWDQQYYVEYSTGASVLVPVNDCACTIILSNNSINKNQVDQTGIPNEISDFTAVDVTPVGDDMAMIKHLDDWLNYIWIELLP